MKKLLFICTCVFFFTHSTHAQEVIEDSVIVNCSPNQYLEENEFYPGKNKVRKSNNLRRKTGIAVFARGKFIKLVGRIVDSSCVPVDDALVEIWHPNDAGYYKSEIKENHDDYDPNFHESGRIFTDNMGNFEFITIYPGRHRKEAPQINVKVTHPNFEELNTVIYFEDEKMNYYDKFLSKFNGKDLERFMAKKAPRPVNMEPPESTYHYVITLVGKNKFKRY